MPSPAASGAQLRSRSVSINLVSALRQRKDQLRNRAALLEAARQVVSTAGADAPFDLVARRAGLSNATLYRHFPTRESLLVEVYRVCLSENLARFSRLDADADPWAAFVLYCRWEFDAHFTDVPLTRALATIPNGLDPELDDQRRQSRDRFADLIQRAKEQGRFRPDRWVDDVLIFFAADESLARLGDVARSTSHRLFDLMLDTLAVERTIEPAGSAPDPLTLDSVLTRYIAEA